MTLRIPDPVAFFKDLRAGLLGPTLSPDEVGGCEAILDAMHGAPLSHCAYALATAYHETNHSMQPIKELGGPSYLFRMYDPQGRRPTLALANGNCLPGDGERFCGRGYVQLTWRCNYEKAKAALNVDLVTTPDLALRADVAALVMSRGMTEGWFTGKSFKSYLPANRPATLGEFVNGRRIINGTDRAAMIAGYAVEFQDALIAGQWGC